MPNTPHDTPRRFYYVPFNLDYECNAGCVGRRFYLFEELLAADKRSLWGNGNLRSGETSTG